MTLLYMEAPILLYKRFPFGNMTNQQGYYPYS